nr:sulfur carrier protein ThiS [Aromatoleum diolicum]
MPSIFIFHGKPQPLIGTLSVVDLLAQLGYAGKRIAVELNGNVVPKSQHSSTWIRVGDNFEIVVAVGGG